MTTRSEFKSAAAAEIARKTHLADMHAQVKTDPFVANFIAMTPAQLRSYVDANVTDMASARTLLKRLAVMLLVLTQKEYLD